ncbi:MULTISPECIES: globin domain-containing protein [Nostocales]|uniref:Bacitracin resistance protein BacA n=3 Tax=Nostocales TaxID=1161 RepID=A0A0C1NE99_9CYAN|nr:globin domain-containing protein [Tolypothrix bouteillei]KAF3887899.1 bacitracin resistance protein BacA [Tolypothrix bouteillei VB521301]
MVSQKTIEIVKLTAPILKKQGLQITTRMYQIMFQKHPEVREKFNMSAQEDGSQPVKLAQAVYGYALQIDNLAALGSMVERIAHRHVEAQVLAEEYPIVGKCLLQAIKDVLGEEGATEEVIAAWTEAYEALSKVFINREHEIYEEDAIQPKLAV